MMAYFKLSKSDTIRFHATTGIGGYYHSKSYVYKVSTVVREAKKKYGSLYGMIAQK
jgi:hypothetical protein